MTSSMRGSVVFMNARVGIVDFASHVDDVVFSDIVEDISIVAYVPSYVSTIVGNRGDDIAGIGGYGDGEVVASVNG